MRNNRQISKTLRRFLDRDLETFSWPVEIKAWPRNGSWTLTVRHALGISQRTLATRVGVSLTAIQFIESREREGKVTLETLHRCAEAMDCQLVYAIVPKSGTFTSILDERAKKLRDGDSFEDALARMRLYDRHDARLWAQEKTKPRPFGGLGDSQKKYRQRLFSLRREL